MRGCIFLPPACCNLPILVLAAPPMCAATGGHARAFHCNADLTLRRILPVRAAAAIAAAPQGVAGIAPQLCNADGTVQPWAAGFPTLTSILRDELRSRPHRNICRPSPARLARSTGPAGPVCCCVAGPFRPSAGLTKNISCMPRKSICSGARSTRARGCGSDPALQATHYQPNAARARVTEVQRHAVRGTLR